MEVTIVFRCKTSQQCLWSRDYINFEQGGHTNVIVDDVKKMRRRFKMGAFANSQMVNHLNESSYLKLNQCSKSSRGKVYFHFFSVVSQTNLVNMHSILWGGEVMFIAFCENEQPLKGEDRGREREMCTKYFYGIYCRKHFPNV